MRDCLLVTGGAGFIGSCFVRDWLTFSKERIVNLDKLSSIFCLLKRFGNHHHNVITHIAHFIERQHTVEILAAIDLGLLVVEQLRERVEQHFEHERTLAGSGKP